MRLMMGKGGSRIVAGEGERKGEGVCAPPSASPWLGSLFSGLTCRLCGANGTAREDPLVFGSGDRNTKMAQHSAVLPGFWMAGEGSKQAGRRRRARDAGGKWKVESGPEPLTRSLRSTQLPDRARVASCELRVAGWGTHHPPTGAVSSSLEMAHGFFKNTPARYAARNANFSFPLF